MNRPAILATLMKQATEEGAQLVTLRAIVEETSELAADRILERLGLDDARAEDDLGKLRELLQAWRDAKASVWKAFIEWVVRAALALLLIAIAYRVGAWEIL